MGHRYGDPWLPLFSLLFSVATSVILWLIILGLIVCLAFNFIFHFV